MKPTRRRSMLALIGTAAAAAAALPVIAATVTGAPTPPDLFAQPAGTPGAQLFKDGRLLLRFDGYIPNAAGAGPLEIQASNPNASDVMTNVSQWIGTTSPGVGGQATSTGTAPRVQFEGADDHNHYHLKNAAEYTLRTLDGAGQVALAQKTQAGFCLEDSQGLGGEDLQGPYSANSQVNGGNNFCWQNHATTGPKLIMGISPNRRDLYGAWLTYQWVNASAVAPGKYKIGSRVDPDNVIVELNENNNGYALRDVTVPGYVAIPKSVPMAGSVPVALDATKFTESSYADGNGEGAGNPGTRRFKVVAGPKHGTLSVAVGQELTGSPTVVYTPNPGSQATDSYSYVSYYTATADDGQTRIYPSNPAPATVTIVGATPLVSLSGAPPSMIAGTSVQLSASVVNGPSGVTWSATAGTVSPTGLFTAPAGGSVTVRATSNDDPSVGASAVIAITAAGVPKPAPGSILSAGNKSLSALKITHVGKRTVITKVATGAKGGKVQVTANFGKTVLARCTYRAGARKTLSCRMKLKKDYNLKKVRITAKYTLGKSSAVRRSFVVR